MKTVQKNIWVGTCITLLIFILGAKVLWQQTQPKIDLPVYGQIPTNLEFLDQNAESLALQSLSGKVWIGALIFTRCAGVCPLMTRHLKRIQGELGASSPVQLVSLSVDPEYDSPEVLKKYMEKHEVDPRNWVFLTGAKKNIYELSIQGMHLGLSEIPEEEREQRDQHLQHSSKFVLIDQKAQIRGYYDSNDAAEREKLIHDATLLAGL